MQSEEYYSQAFSRNKGLITDQVQEKLKNTRVAIPGMGGVGGIHTTTLARLGVGAFTIADGDVYEHVNFNRQVGAMTSTLGKEKNDVMETILRDINPFLDIKKFGLITEENIDAFLEGVDIVVDGMDFFEFETRRLIFNTAREKGIPVITAAPVGFGSVVHVFTKDSVSFDEYFAIKESMTLEEKLLYFGIGLVPALLQRSYFAPKKVKFDDKKSPSSVLGTLAAANWVGTTLLKIVEGKKVEVAPVSFHFDPYVQKVKRVNLLFGNRHPIQRLKIWYLARTLLNKTTL